MDFLFTVQFDYTINLYFICKYPPIKKRQPTIRLAFFCLYFYQVNHQQPMLRNFLPSIKLFSIFSKDTPLVSGTIYMVKKIKRTLNKP